MTDSLKDSFVFYMSYNLNIFKSGGYYEKTQASQCSSVYGSGVLSSAFVYCNGVFAKVCFYRIQKEVFVLLLRQYYGI